MISAAELVSSATGDTDPHGRVPHDYFKLAGPLIPTRDLASSYRGLLDGIPYVSCVVS
jgi:hypothetical protein